MSLINHHAEELAAAKSSRSAPKVRGNLKPAEIKPLVITARQAFDFQRDLGNLEDGETFDTWRAKQCLEVVGKPGISSCHHDDWKPLMAHFLACAGRDAESLAQQLKTGKARDHAESDDTHEARRLLAHLIAEQLAAHIHLANTTAEQLQAEMQSAYYEELGADFEIPWESTTGPRELRKLIARKDAIAAREKGHVDVGYVVWITRQKTRRPDLKLGTDWQAGLADRCTVRQLTQIRDTLVNRINAIEGVGETRSRNKAQTRAAKSPKGKAARSKNEIDDLRW